MKRIVFYCINFITSFLFGYLALRFVYFGALLKNAKFLDSYSSEEKIQTGIMFWLPIILFIGIEIAILIFGKKIFEGWGWKERIIIILSSVTGIIASGIILVFLNP